MTEFATASDRAARCLELVAIAVRFGTTGNFNAAYDTLFQLRNFYNECYAVMAEWSDRLAAISDGQIEVPGWQKYCSSAHETAISIARSALNTLLIPVVSDEGDFDAVLGDWVRIPVTDAQENRRRA